MTTRPASILHVDMDAFFASVEALENPALRGKPLIVGGDGRRGVVASCSYEARYYGIKSAMPSVRAKRLCPHAVFVRGNYSRYEFYSRRMHEVFQEFTPIVEGLSLDEAFLDVSGATRLFGTPTEIAHAIRGRIADFGLSASVGVATTKHLAKLASEAAKPRPSKQGPIPGSGVVVIEEHEAQSFLFPLPVRAIWGIGPRTAERLVSAGIVTVGDIAQCSLDRLTAILGDHSATRLKDLAANRDDRAVEPHHEAKSVGHEQTFSHDQTTVEDVHRELARLADAVASRLRSSHVVGRTITVKVRFGDFRTYTRAKTIDTPTANGLKILRTAEALCAEFDVSRGIRLLGISMSKLAPANEQLDLMATPSTDETLDVVVDGIRSRFGESAVMPGLVAGVTGRGVLKRGERQWGPNAGDEKPHDDGPGDGSEGPRINSGGKG